MKNNISFNDFCSKLKILSKDNVISFKLFAWQNKLSLKLERSVKSKNKHYICLASRQCGITTLLCAYALWYVNTHDSKHVAFLCDKFIHGILNMTVIKNMYNSLPENLKKPLKRNRKNLLEFIDGSYIFTDYCNINACRRRHLDMIIIDDAAYINNLADFCKSIFPIFLLNSQIIISSTAKNGDNEFKHIWNASKNRNNTFKRFKISWNCRPERNVLWKNDLIRNFGKLFFDCEYNGKFVNEDLSTAKDS